MQSIDDILRAAEDDRLFVKVGREWFLANVTRVWLFDNDDWIIAVRAGPNRRRGQITNIQNNAEGRDYLIRGA